MDVCLNGVIILFLCILMVILFMLFDSIKSFLINVSNKSNVESEFKVQEIINNSIAQGCSFAEQWGKKIFKENNVKPNSSNKLTKAIEYTVEDLHRHGIFLSENEIKNKVESFLGIATLNLSSLPALFQEDGDENPFLSSD